MVAVVWVLYIYIYIYICFIALFRWLESRSIQMVSEWNCPLDKKTKLCFLIHYMGDHKASMENLIWKNSTTDQQHRLWHVCHCICHWFKLWIWLGKLTLCGWKKLRVYLLQYLQDGYITPFPSTPMKKRKLLLQSVNIYCKCRLPYIFKHKKNKLVNKQDDIKMVYCDCCQIWYHFKCLHVNGKSACSITRDEKNEWICDDCVKEFNLFSDDSN